MQNLSCFIKNCSPSWHTTTTRDQIQKRLLSFCSQLAVRIGENESGFANVTPTTCRSHTRVYPKTSSRSVIFLVSDIFLPCHEGQSSERIVSVILTLPALCTHIQRGNKKYSEWQTFAKPTCGNFHFLPPMPNYHVTTNY